MKKSKSKNLLSQFKKVFNEVSKDINNNQKTISILNKDFKLSLKLKELKKFKRFKTIALIGMGGSILGAEAINNFLENKISKKVYFFNDLNESKILDFKKREKISNVLFIIISKSGNTIETLSNAFLLNVFKKNSKNVIIISERKNNLLFNISKNFNLFHIAHNEYVGGRYSVLSEVGIIPAYLMGANIFKLRHKIKDCLSAKRRASLRNNTIKMAKFIKSKKTNNLIFLNYAPELEKFLYWYQQLIAESLGKKNKGFLPVISNVPKDHHSLLQLYLDGPRDKFFVIFTCEDKSINTIDVKSEIFKKNIFNKKKFSTIKSAQKNALIKAFKNKKIPFREFKIKKNNEETLGKLFAYFILETILIGKLVNINPFNQPAVEVVKNFTKQLLNQRHQK